MSNLQATFAIFLLLRKVTFYMRVSLINPSWFFEVFMVFSDYVITKVEFSGKFLSAATAIDISRDHQIIVCNSLYRSSIYRLDV